MKHSDMTNDQLDLLIQGMAKKSELKFDPSAWNDLKTQLDITTGYSGKGYWNFLRVNLNKLLVFTIFTFGVIFTALYLESSPEKLSAFSAPFPQLEPAHIIRTHKTVLPNPNRFHKQFAISPDEILESTTPEIQNNIQIFIDSARGFDSSVIHPIPMSNDTANKDMLYMIW